MRCEKIKCRLLLLVSVMFMIMAVWLWTCSQNMEWAWKDGMSLEAFPDGGICLQSERGAILELQQEGVESNTGEPMVLSEGSSIRWRDIAVINDYPRWIIKCGGNQVSPEQENASGRQQHYCVYADEGEIRTVPMQERRVYEMSPHAISWLYSCVLRLEQYLRVKKIIIYFSSLLSKCILAVVLLCPFRVNILSVCSLICLPGENTGSWRTVSIGELSFQWREEKLSWWMRMFGARYSYVSFRTHDGKHKVLLTRVQEVRQLLWCFKYKQDEEIVTLWNRLEPSLFPVDVSLWSKVRYAWKAAGMDDAPRHPANILCKKPSSRRLKSEFVLVCSVLLLLASVGNLIYVGRTVVKDVTANEAITWWRLVNEAGCRLDIVQNADGEIRSLEMGNDAEVTWSGVKVQARRTGYFVCGKNDERFICEKNADAEHASVMHGIALDIGNDGQIVRQREWKSAPQFEIRFNSMEIYRRLSEDFFQYSWKMDMAHLAYITAWLCVAVLVFLSPLRAICFSIGSILCLLTEKDDRSACRKTPPLWMKLLGAQISYMIIDAAGKKWICPTDYPGLFVYDQQREKSVIERCCSEELLAFDAPVFEKIRYAIIKAF